MHDAGKAQPTQPVAHAAEAQQHVHGERGKEHPGAVEVRGVEAEGEEVGVLRVEHAGDQFEADASDEKQQRDALDGLGWRGDGRPGEQPGEHGPKLEQDERNEHQSDGDVETLVHPVQPHRMRGPREQVEAEQALAMSLVVDPVEVRVVRGVGQQAGHEHHRQAGQQDQAEDRGQPGAADRASPEGPAERAGHLTGAQQPAQPCHSSPGG